MIDLLKYPFDSSLILRKKKSIKKELEKQKFSSEIRIAILGGSTTEDIKNILELFLMDKGIKSFFYESEYNKWYEDAVFENKELNTFNPQFIYIHTSFVNLYAEYSAFEFSNEAEFLRILKNKYKLAWNSLNEKYNCPIIQNNFELPFYRVFGNLDFSKSSSLSNIVLQMNSYFVDCANSITNLFIQDINFMSASIGLEKWYDRDFFHLYKVAMSYDSIPFLAFNLGSMIASSLGKSKKCLVLDLDNTLWGGIIGDDGVNGIQIGHETPVGETFYEFQQYVKNLKNRGVILAVCSKNDINIAKEGFLHPDSLLKYEDFASFIANWDSKAENIKRIAKEINIGLDSIVFIDDNSMERDLVREFLPEVSVPEVKEGQPSSYISAIEKCKYFEQLSISKDDLKRNQAYEENKKRLEMEQACSSYSDYLRNLKMTAEIRQFEDIYLERITQLTNKSNQFNLTTRRYTNAEITKVAHDDGYITLYGRLRDKFGDNGLVSVIIGKIVKDELQIELWLMSCRVLRRNFEYTMFYELLKKAEQAKISKIRGFYYKTLKNGMVKDFFDSLGFHNIKTTEESSEWLFDLKKDRCAAESFCALEE